MKGDNMLAKVPISTELQKWMDTKGADLEKQFLEFIALAMQKADEYKVSYKQISIERMMATMHQRDFRNTRGNHNMPKSASNLGEGNKRSLKRILKI